MPMSVPFSLLAFFRTSFFCLQDLQTIVLGVVFLSLFSFILYSMCMSNLCRLSFSCNTIYSCFSHCSQHSFGPSAIPWVLQLFFWTCFPGQLNYSKKTPAQGCCYKVHCIGSPNLNAFFHAFFTFFFQDVFCKFSA